MQQPSLHWRLLVSECRRVELRYPLREDIGCHPFGHGPFCHTCQSEQRVGECDAIGVYMLDAGTGNIRNSAMNIQYNADVAETSTETNFVAAADGIGIY